MEITNSIIRDSVAQRPFGTFEPFINGTDDDISSFYSRVLSALERVRSISVSRELDHHGSGYASYVSAFLFPRDGSSRRDYPDYSEVTGILLYMSRLAPIAVYGASARTENKHDSGGSSGFIGTDNLGILPQGDWSAFLSAVTGCLHRFGIEVLPREPLLRPAPDDITIPTVFDGPYYVFDTLFYWSD
ncbi:hypothetical protein ACXR0O_25485 [Verrucomicrobiota bacterium sgz303538]